MSSSRDDFGIAFRSALLQRGAAQKFSLVSLIFIAIIVFILDVYGFAFMKPIRSIINDGIYRVSLVASSPSRFLPQATESVSNLFNLKKENENLKKALEVYKQKELSVEYLTNQNKNLRKILESEESFLKKENMILSKVLIDKSSPYLKSIIINRGSKSGILKGMPVMDKDYLIGRVVETNYLSSRVLLLNDLNSRIPVVISPNGDQAILSGTGRKKPILEYLPENFVISENNSVYTSGKDGVLYAGISIGKAMSEEDLDDRIDVELYSDPNQIFYVNVVLQKATDLEAM